MIPGVTPWNGKKNPVILVNAVVSKNMPFQPPSLFPPIIPKTTMNPVKMPARLKST
jgi:hypothetical protein